MPDIFLPLDTTNMSPYFMEVSGRNILYKYTIDYADRHRAQLDAVENVADLKALLDADTNLLDDFVAYAAARGVRPDPAGITRSRELMLAQLRAYIGRNTKLEDVGFYSNIYPVDDVIVKAIEVLESEENTPAAAE